MPVTQLKSPTLDLPRRRHDDTFPFRPRPSLSWSAVLAGGVTGVVLQLWLSILGFAAGITHFDPLSNPVLQSLTTPGLFWLAASAVAACWTGGWVAGRFSGAFRRSDAALHGLASWAAVHLAAFLLAGTLMGPALFAPAPAPVEVVTPDQAAIDQALYDANAALAQARAATALELNEMIPPVEQQDFFPDDPAPDARALAADALSNLRWSLAAVMFMGLCSAVAGAASTVVDQR